MMAVRHIRRHWKKYLAGQVVGTFLISYITRKHRERNIIRQYCNLAKAYGEVTTSMLDRPKKLMVFLNASANNLDAKAQFNKYAAPLFYLSGMDVTVVESQYVGHIKMLMEYVDPRTDGIVVAGGDGTILEVLNGLRRRKDAETMRTIPVGILPLGKENKSFKTLFPSFQYQSQARMLGEASLKIIHGLTKQIPVIEIQPEKGKTVCALSSVQWGVFKDAWRDRNRFKLFGKLRVLMSHLSTAARHWPEEGCCGHTVCLAPVSSDEKKMRPALVQPNVDTIMRWVEHPGWSKREQEDLAGFKITPSATHHDSLSLSLWPRALLSKSMLIKHGWCLTTHGGDAERCPVPGKSVEVQQVVMVPEFSGGWLSVDGEEYESLPMTIRLEPDSVKVFS